MRVLLDECLPHTLKSELIGHEVSTVQEEGWSSLKNGKLLQVASDRFDVFLTADRSLPFQQNLKVFDIAVVAIVSGGIRIDDLLPLMAEVRSALERATPGQLIRVGGGPDRFRLRDSRYTPTLQTPINSWS